MNLLLGAGVLVMIVADAVVGLRLLVLAMRTRALPELGIGGALVLLGALGYPISIAARSGAGGSPEADAAMLTVAMACQNLGCAAMAVAIVSTFRPRDAWARALAALFGGMLLVSWMVEVATGDFMLRAGSSTAYWIGLAGRVGPFVWAAAEAWRYHGVLKRRLRIGLTDALVTDRFRLWAISSSGVVVAFATFALGILSGAELASSPWVLVPTSLAGWVSGISLWLAFLPPLWYLRRLQETTPI